MKKFFIILPLMFLIGCVTTGQAYLPHTSRVFHAKKNCAGCNDPNPIIFQSVQDAANSSGIVPCNICIKTNQYTPSSSYKSSYTQYPSSYPSQATGNQNTTSSFLGGGTVSGTAPVQPTSKPSYSTPSSSYRTSGYGYKSYSYDVSGYNYNGDYVYGEVVSTS